MKTFASCHAPIALILLALYGCSGASKDPAGAASSDSGDFGSAAVEESGRKILQPEANKEESAKDKLASYAALVGRDSAEIEKLHQDTLGAAPAATFNEAWLKFFLVSDPALAPLQAYVPELYAPAYKAALTHGLVAQTNNNNEPWISISYPDGGYYSYAMNVSWSASAGINGSGTQTSSVEDQHAAARVEAANKDRATLLGLNAVLLLAQSRLIEHGQRFGLGVERVTATDFQPPENYFGTLVVANFDPEFKDLLIKLLYSASLKNNGEFFSFFQFAGDSSAGFAWIPVSTNVLNR